MGDSNNGKSSNGSHYSHSSTSMSGKKMGYSENNNTLDDAPRLITRAPLSTFDQNSLALAYESSNKPNEDKCRWPSGCKQRMRKQARTAIKKLSRERMKETGNGNLGIHFACSNL